MFDSTGRVVGLVSYRYVVGSDCALFPDHDDIISSNSNFIGKTLNTTWSSWIWVRAQYSITNPDLQGIYIVSSSTSGLLSGSVITHIEVQPVGLYRQYGQVTPIQLYMHNTNTIQVILENGSNVRVPLIDISSGEDIPQMFWPEPKQWTHRATAFRHLDAFRGPCTSGSNIVISTSINPTNQELFTVESELLRLHNKSSQQILMNKKTYDGFIKALASKNLRPYRCRDDRFFIVPV